MSTDQIVTVHCNRCGDSTRHRVVHETTTSGNYNEGGEPESDEPHCPDEDDWRVGYVMLECCGCGGACLRQTAYSWDPVDDTTEKEVQFYPPRLFRRIPNWHRHLPPDVVALLKEVYAAVAADSRRLAVMGARALLDMVIVDKVGDQGPFRRKLETLESDGYISRANRDYLAAAIEAGNAAAHRGHLPSVDSVAKVIDIVENLLQAVYVLPDAGSALKRETPPR